MPTRVLITGATGPVGSFLARYLTSLPDVDVHIFKRWRSNVRPIQDLLDRLTIHEGDIEDPFSVAAAVRAAAPDRVYHLAGQSYPSASWGAPIATLRTNTEGTANLLEAVRTHAPAARVHIAGSAAEYGTVAPEDVPIKETHPLRPASPYGVSKVGAELLGLQYHESYGLHVVVTRSFIHVGPHQGDRCSIQTFCQQMAQIEAGLQPPVIAVGNLAAERDFTHVADVARALWLVLTHGKPGNVYNLCSHRATRIGDIVDLVLARGRVAAEIWVDPARLRPTDEPVLIGDNTRLRADTGWQPTINIEQIVDEIVTYWRDSRNTL
jgi:GDP-4-dehydro-6-deoxy-D-mannose reductase